MVTELNSRKREEVFLPMENGVHSTKCQTGCNASATPIIMAESKFSARRFAKL